MDEIKLIKDIGFIIISIGIFYALKTYVFTSEEQEYTFSLLLPLGMDFLRLSYRYVNFRNDLRKKDYIILKKSTMSLGSFHSPIVMSIALIYFYEMDTAMWFIIPFIILEALYAYDFQRRHIFSFGDWSIKDLSNNKSIKHDEIKEFELMPNRLKVVYSEEDDNDDDDDDDDDDDNLLIIRRGDISFPNSWYEFEKIAKRFETEVLQKES